jgi:uncharacterized protein YndB with AHSA1/START domain
MTGNVPQLESSIEIAAPPDRVWALVSDVRRMPEWSPTVSSTRLRSGYERVELGAEFTNLNVMGELEWKTRGTIVRFEPERQLAFRIADNWVVWAFHLEPLPSGTLLTQRRETPDGISEKSLQLTDAFMGGQEAFTASLQAGMAETLRRLKAAAEG